MHIKPFFPLKVFYDGSCYVCSKEMLVYMAKNHDGRLEFVDISAPDFYPGQYGIPLAEFMFQMHAIDQTGKVFRGVDAFSAIWQAFPTSRLYRFLSFLVTFPGARIAVRMAYLAFARFRKYLPKRKAAACKMGNRHTR
jgi:predicted DCC family thiol-disulfide oxidoreductase YuxK